MTVHEIYDQNIKSLPTDARLELARLILNDLAPDPVRDQDHLEELLLAGLNSGPAIEATPDYWQQKRASLLARVDQKIQTP